MGGFSYRGNIWGSWSHAQCVSENANAGDVVSVWVADEILAARSDHGGQGPIRAVTAVLDVLSAESCATPKSLLLEFMSELKSEA